MARLPAPMLARSGELPTGGNWIYELKLDGFRALVRTGSDFTVRSRRGWNMTQRVPELAVDAVSTGELVALSSDGWPHFPAVCDRVLHGDHRIRLTYVVFDVLELEGEPTIRLPLRDRRQLLDGLGLHGPHWRAGEFTEALPAERITPSPRGRPVRTGARPDVEGRATYRRRRPVHTWERRRGQAQRRRLRP